MYLLSNVASFWVFMVHFHGVYPWESHQVGYHPTSKLRMSFIRFFFRTGDHWWWGRYPDSNEADLDDHSLLNFWCRNSRILWIWLVSYDSWIHIFRVFLVALIGATKLNKIIRQSFEMKAMRFVQFFLIFHYLKRVWRNLHIQTLYLPWTKPLLRVFLNAPMVAHQTTCMSSFHESFPKVSEPFNIKMTHPIGSMYGKFTHTCSIKSTIHVGKYLVPPMDPSWVPPCFSGTPLRRKIHHVFLNFLRYAPWALWPLIPSCIAMHAQQHGHKKRGCHTVWGWGLTMGDPMTVKWSEGKCFFDKVMLQETGWIYMYFWIYLCLLDDVFFVCSM